MAVAATFLELSSESINPDDEPQSDGNNKKKGETVYADNTDSNSSTTDTAAVATHETTTVATAGKENSIEPSPQPPRLLTQKESDLYFANKAMRLEIAEEKLKRECLLPDLDGEFVAMFVLTEIDHWNHDRERVVLQCECSVLVVNYSFITEKWTELTRINLKCISRIHFAKQLTFKKMSLQWPRDDPCIKITYQRLTGPVTVSENWNPLAKHLPWCILTSHPLKRRPEGNTDKYDVEKFKCALVEMADKYRLQHPDAPHSPEVIPEGTAPIEMDVRLGLSSFIVNQSHLAYAKDRGGIHF